jgi:predicted nucleotidyltransferase
VSILSEEQIRDLCDLEAACALHGTVAVIIGAVAYRLFIDDADRATRDIDLAVALDLEEFAALAKDLTKIGWRQAERREHRWRSPRGTFLDLLPAGPSLRAGKRVAWPSSQLSMSLLGFDHVFRDCVETELSPGLTFKVVPPPVLALLKIVAYLDDRHRRAKDLADLRQLWRRYERSSDRLFCDEVFGAELPDIGLAGAFLLGLDLRVLCTREEVALVRSFLNQAGELRNQTGLEIEPTWTFCQHLDAFAKGFDWER